jgi:hypothetical protein
MTLTIENKTPWNTEDLTEFLTPLCERAGTAMCEVVILRAAPGRKRAEQELFNVSYPRPYRGPRSLCHIKIGLLSPKRAAARTELLDRMAQAGDLVTHESALPATVVQGVAHAFDKAVEWSKGADHEWTHVNGGCGCDLTSVPAPLIRGNTKIKTAPPVDIENMRKRLTSAKNAIRSHTRRRDSHARDLKKYQDFLDKAVAKEAHLEERIAIEEAKLK